MAAWQAPTVYFSYKVLFSPINPYADMTCEGMQVVLLLLNRVGPPVMLEGFARVDLPRGCGSGNVSQTLVFNSPI